PWLSWSTVFRTAAGRSARFSFFSFSCEGVCCVAACDASAQVRIRRGTVHRLVRMTILAVGRDQILPGRTLQRAYRPQMCGLNSAPHARVELRRVFPPTITQESYVQTVNPHSCTARRRRPGVARRELGASIQGREV